MLYLIKKEVILRMPVTPLVITEVGLVLVVVVVLYEITRII